MAKVAARKFMTTSIVLSKSALLALPDIKQTCQLVTLHFNLQSNNASNTT